MNLTSGFNIKRLQWRRYGVAILTVAIALLVKLLLDPFIRHEAPFLMFFAAVLVSARCSGIKAGVLATILSAVVCQYFFLTPVYSFTLSFGKCLQLLLFVTEGIALSKVVASLNAAKRRAEVSKLEVLQHQETLRQSEERFRLLVEGVREYAIFMLDLEGCVLSWNVGAERIFGYQEAEIIGTHFSIFFTPEDIHNAKPEREQKTAIVEGQADDERWHIRKDGTSFWATGVLVALKDETGALRGFSKVVRDISDRKQAAEALQKAYDELEIRVEQRTIQLRNTNKQLESEIVERKRVESALQKEQEFLNVLLDNLEAGIVACDAEGVLTLFNHSTQKFHGLPEQPLPVNEWAKHYDLYLPDGKTPMKKEDIPLFRALQGERVSNVEMMIVPKQGIARTLSASGQALFDVQGKKLGAVAIMHDITQRKQAEEALLKSEAKNRAILNAIPDLILCISKDGTYLGYKPPNTFKMLASGSDLIGKSEYEVLPLAVAQQRMHYVKQALSTGETQVFEYQLPLNGATRDEEARVVVSGDSEVLVIVRDITERKQTEEALQKSQTRLKLINSISTAGMILGMSVETIVQRTVKQTSKHFKSLRVAYSIVDQQGKLTVIHAVQPETMPQNNGLVIDLNAAPEYLNTLRNNKPIIIDNVAQDHRSAPLASAMLNAGIQALIEIPFEHSKKSVSLLCFESSLPRNWSKHEITTIVGITQYLSVIVKNARAEQERKRSGEALKQAHDELETRVRERTAELAKANEELKTKVIECQRTEQELGTSEERLRLALKAAHMDTWDWDILENQINYSNNHQLLFALTPGKPKGTYETFLERVHPQDIQSVAAAITRSIEEKTDYDYEFRIVCPDGSIRWLVGKGQVFYDETGTTAVRMMGITMDITERKTVAEQIKASLKEKEVLLKEIHHRVKNNLQIISSLLNLQSAYVEDQKTLDILKAGENRVASMAMIHEQLYQSRDLAKINFAEYIENLVANLLSSYDVDSNKIALYINIDSIALDVDTAIPCGLIINELVSNSLKYAFPNDIKGKIYINSYANDSNYLIIVVGDNGIGFPLDVNFQNTDSLGLQIVTALTNQLEGTIELNRDLGTEFKLILRQKSI